MTKKNLHKIITILITFVWLVNGLYCKILNYVPRHQEIVVRILGNEYAPILTKLIGFMELIMVAWIVSGIKPRLNAITQIIVILSMNIIEFTLARDLLLFGWANLIIALLFSAIIYVNDYRLRKIHVQS